MKTICIPTSFIFMFLLVACGGGGGGNSPIEIPLNQIEISENRIQGTSGDKLITYLQEMVHGARLHGLAVHMPGPGDTCAVHESPNR